MPKGSHRPNASCHVDRKHYAKGMCFNCYRRDYYETNREWRDKVIGRARQYAVNNREKVLESKKIYYLNNREALLKQGREFYQQNRPAIRFRRKLQLVGITPSEYETMIRNQGGSCAICGGDNNGRPLIVDHCHKTKIVRGLLCHRCNVGIGNLKDSAEVIESALNYLKQTQTDSRKVICG